MIDILVRDPVRRGLLFDLCRELKSNPLTREMEVIAILAGPDRPGLEKLYWTGVDRVYQLQVNQRGQNSTGLNLLVLIDTARKPQDILEQLCPLTGYDPVAGIAACGAHGDRLILGKERLAGLCTTKEHAACEFFLKSSATRNPGGLAFSSRRSGN